jgi:hypothetical protein
MSAPEGTLRDADVRTVRACAVFLSFPLCRRLRHSVPAPLLPASHVVRALTRRLPTHHSSFSGCTRSTCGSHTIPSTRWTRCASRRRALAPTSPPSSRHLLAHEPALIQIDTRHWPLVHTVYRCARSPPTHTHTHTHTHSVGRAVCLPRLGGAAAQGDADRVEPLGAQIGEHGLRVARADTQVVLDLLHGLAAIAVRHQHAPVGRIGRRALATTKMKGLVARPGPPCQINMRVCTRTRVDVCATAHGRGLCKGACAVRVQAHVCRGATFLSRSCSV